MTKRRNGEQISQKDLGGVMRHFLEHVTDHDPERVHAAVIIVANEMDPTKDDPPDANPMHVCHFGAGDPEILANIMADAIDGLINNNPEFSEAFHEVMKRRALKNIVEQIAGQVREMHEETGMAAAKPSADEVIKKAMEAQPGNDTKH